MCSSALVFQLQYFSGIICFWNHYNCQDFGNNFPSEGPFSVCLACDIAVEEFRVLSRPRIPYSPLNGSTQSHQNFSYFCARLINGDDSKALGEQGAQVTLNSLGFISLNRFGPSQSLDSLTMPATDRKLQEVWHRGSHHDYLKHKMSMAKVKSFSKSLIYTSPEEPALFTVILNQHRLCKYRLATAHASSFGGPLLCLKLDAGALTDLGCNAYRQGRKPGSVFWVVAKHHWGFTSYQPLTSCRHWPLWLLSGH